MDSTKPSLSSKAPYVNNGGANDSPMEEQGRDGVDADPDVDLATAADVNQHHRGTADKQKYNTLGYERRTKQKVVTDFSTLSKGASAGVKPRAALKQVLFNQGVSDKTSEDRGQLVGLKQDLGAFPVPPSLKWIWKEESQGTTLEKSWTDIVYSHSTMAKMQRHQQEALWEFITTELVYINKLMIIKDLAIAALMFLRQRGHLPEVEPVLLFSNLHSVLGAHQLFWQQVIYPMLQEVRKTGKPFDPMKLEAGCLQFPERFSSYKRYCWEEQNNLEFSHRWMESNAQFLLFVQWLESRPQCERMRLGDMQARPHLRITKYSLLLAAVLKNTPDPHIQHTLRGMLSSVKGFLESINDYMRLKDEELALSISAQRVEGYEVEGISEEIDKYVQEISQFDLTTPIRGVGSKVIRKLLLEENVKVRGRKDNKLEVVALLFSDVILMTKVQKKGERLKVVRPPLALDRTYCMALKDVYSFVLVEVGELQSVMNVLILVAATPDSCSTWVSTIHQAKETLRELRQMERSRLENLRTLQLEAKHVTGAKSDDAEPEEPPATRLQRESFAEKITDQFILSRSVNGSREAAPAYRPPDPVVKNNTGSHYLPPHPNVHPRHLQQRHRAARQPGHEWIELKSYGEVNHPVKDHDKVAESAMTNDHRSKSVPDLDLFTQRTAADPLRSNTTGPHSFGIGGLPDVDYPPIERSTLQLHDQSTTHREAPKFLLVPPDSSSRFLSGQPADSDPSAGYWGVSKHIKSPIFRKRRPVSAHQSSSVHTVEHFHQGSVQAGASSNSFSSSNSDSESNFGPKRNSLPLSSSPNSHKVLTLSSLKPSQGMFWGMPDKDTDSQIFSESELPDHREKPKLKTQRSASIPQILLESGHETRLHASSLHALSQRDDSNLSSQQHPSSLMGLLERSKERGRDRNVSKRDGNITTPILRRTYPAPSSSSFSSTPSPPASEGDRDTEWEEMPSLSRRRVLTVSKGWREQLVDGDEDDHRSSVVFSDGVNVDWSGWCFDDDEVMDHMQPQSHEGLLEGINRSLASSGLNQISEQDDDECSQV